MKVQDVQQYRIFVDLDGVLADFEAGVHKLLQARFGSAAEEYLYQTEANPTYRAIMWETISLFQKLGNGFWYSLLPMVDAHHLWNYVEKYNPQILSATGKEQYGADKQKIAWVYENIGTDVPINLVRRAVDKATYAAPNHILIDDKLKATEPFIAAGGIAILHTSAASTISQLKQIGL